MTVPYITGTYFFKRWPEFTVGNILWYVLKLWGRCGNLKWMKCFIFLPFYNDLDLNNQKYLWLPSIYEFERKLGFWTTLIITKPAWALFCFQGCFAHSCNNTLMFMALGPSGPYADVVTRRNSQNAFWISKTNLFIISHWTNFDLSSLFSSPFLTVKKFRTMEKK